MQTSIEWLEEKLKVSFSEELNPLRGFFVIAKEMHKAEIAEAYRTGVEEDVYFNPLRTGEQYYNQTYKQ